MRERYAAALAAKILKDLNDSIKVPTAKELELERAYLQIEQRERVNVDIRLIKLGVTETLSTRYQGFKDYRFWLQQSQLGMKYSDDWESALDYLASGLRELPLNL